MDLQGEGWASRGRNGHEKNLCTFLEQAMESPAPHRAHSVKLPHSRFPLPPFLYPPHSSKTNPT